MNASEPAAAAVSLIVKLSWSVVVPRMVVAPFALATCSQFDVWSALLTYSAPVAVVVCDAAATCRVEMFVLLVPSSAFCRRHGQRMHERAPKAAVDAYARRGHRHRRAWRGYIAFQAASTRAYIRAPNANARGIHAGIGHGHGFSHVYLRSEPRLRTRQHRGAGRHHSAHAQRSTVASSGRQQGAPRSHSLFWPVYLSNGPSKRVSYTPSAMAIPSREDFSRAPLGTEVGKLTSGHGQAAYNQKKHRHWRPYHGHSFITNALHLLSCI